MPNTKAARPNVIVFFTDQQRWDSTGVHGNPLDLTPNFDDMARRGTDVHYSFTVQPVCTPARACLQTGLYATTHQVYRNGIPLPTHCQTLAHHFKAAGYATGYVGKWHLASDVGVGAVPIERRGGYDYWLASQAIEATSDVYDTVVYNNDNTPVKLPGYRVDALTDAAIRYVDVHQAEPFYLFISYLEPHHQNHIDDYPPPRGYRERYTGRWTPPDLVELGGSTAQHLGGYWGMVKRLDEALGRLLDALESLRLLDNTVVLFTSDHGNHFKTRNNEYKRSGHDSSIRVPTAICGPGFDGGGRVHQLVSLIDLTATLLDAASLPLPAKMQGRSILPLLRGQREGWPEEVFVQVSETQVARVVRTHRWKYGVAAPDKDGWNDMASEHYVEEYLYDLKADPYELTNLIGIGSHREVANVMRERLLRRMEEAGEVAPSIELAPERSSQGPFGRRKVEPQEVYA
ncbi:MAG: sulfatase-like hydrolase/transferase [Caldilineaceae bacterium]|nr:sulfatase-like hydrolase/transferase [Caldilineaceae bacterium]